MKKLVVLVMMCTPLTAYSLTVKSHRFTTGLEYREQKINESNDRSSELEWNIAKGLVRYEEDWDTYYDISRIREYNDPLLKDHDENAWELYLRHRKRLEKKEHYGKSWSRKIGGFARVEQDELSRDKEYEVGLEYDVGTWLDDNDYIQFSPGISWNYEEDFSTSEEKYFGDLFLDFLWRHNFNKKWYNIFLLQNNLFFGDCTGYSLDLIEYVKYDHEFGDRCYFEMRHGFELENIVSSEDGSDGIDQQTFFTEYELGQRKAINEDWDVRYYAFYEFTYEMTEWTKDISYHEYGLGIALEYRW